MALTIGYRFTTSINGGRIIEDVKNGICMGRGRRESQRLGKCEIYGKCESDS